jgi:hypothetical protein
MELAHLPLLRTQRDLYRLPLGMERFREYLDALIDKAADDIKLPLSGMNPMGKEHLPAFLDGLISMDAEGAASSAVDRARADLAAEPGRYRVCLVVEDDLRGGWTNRYASELAHLMDQRDMRKRGWLTVPLWTSETYTPAKVASSVLACIHRTAYAQRHGHPASLGDVLAQERAVMTAISSAAGAAALGRGLDREEAAYTREALRPLHGASDMPTLIAALFGDEAARQLGHAPLGLSERAGLALALTPPDQNQDLTLK